MKKTFLHCLGIIGLLLMSISANGANYARVTISKSSVSTGDGKIYISTANAKPLEPNTQATSSKADRDYQEKTFYFWADAETGSRFVGWADANNKQDVIANSDVQPYTENFNAAGGAGTSDKYADYNRYAVFFLNTYTIAFDKNAEDATGTTESVNATYSIDATLTANGFEREGWNFDGWNTQADGLGTTYGDGAIVKNLTAEHEATVTLYAQWSQSAVDPNFVQNIATFNLNKVYNNVVESSNKESVLTLSVANESEAGVAEFLTGNVLYVYKTGTFDIVANQPEVAGKFNAVVDKVVATCTVTTATWEWTPETPDAGNYYLLNSQYENQDNFLKAVSVITTAPAEATLFTFAVNGQNVTITYDDGKYVSQANGNQNWGTGTGTWKVVAANPVDDRGEGWKITSNVDNNRHIAIANTGTNKGNVEYIRQNWGNYFYVWNYISAAQMDAYLAYTQLSEYVSTRVVSDELKNEAVATLSANGFDSEYDYATRLANLQAVIDEYDASVESLTLVPLNNDENDYYATFSSEYAVEFAEDVTIYTVSVSEDTMSLNEVTGKKVPANTGVLIKKTASEIATYYIITSAEELTTPNFLHPGAETVEAEEGHTYYSLAYADFELKTDLGFYWVEYTDESHTAFYSEVGTAYLDIQSATAPARFLLGRRVPTEIVNLNSTVNVAKKVLRNGQVFIVRDGKLYDLRGMVIE